jgi:hypothetical protein
LAKQEKDRVLSGGCLCGAVQYKVRDAFRYAMNCHCSQCRRATGSAVAKGAESLAIDGTPDNHNAFCKRCGSLLYSMVRDGTYVHVTYGTLADAPALRPTAHIHVGSKAPWFTITDDLPQHEEL